MTKSALPKPIIMHLPYQSIENRVEIEKALSESCGDVPLSVVERSTLHYLFDYPTVYVVHSEKRNKDYWLFRGTRYMWAKRTIFTIGHAAFAKRFENT